MFKVELKEGMNVETADGRELGRINRFVLNPQTNEVTHIVVEKGLLLPEDKVVPFEMVRSTEEDKVILREDIADFDELPPFEESYYIEADERSLSTDRASHEPAPYRTAPGYYWYPPHGYLGFPAYGLASYSWPRAETVQNIPPDTVPLKEGTNVMSSDGRHVGEVARLLVETGSNKATHFLISQGTFFPDHKMIPVIWIRSVTEEEVHLSVTSGLLKRLPSYEPE